MLKRVGQCTLLIGFACIPIGARAQVNPDSILHRNECRLAAQVLTTGQPANKTGWALDLIPLCGATGGSAVAELVRRHARATAPSEFEPLVELATQLRDRAVYNAALAVATDTRATEPARIQSIRILAAQLNPMPTAVRMSYLYYAGTAGDSTKVYIGETIAAADDGHFEGSPLPPNAYDETARAMTNLVDQPGQSAGVRHAATVLLNKIEAFREECSTPGGPCE